MALALVYHATSTGGVGRLKQNMCQIVDATHDFATDSEFRPPPTWTKSDKNIVNEARDSLVSAIPNSRKGATAPIIHVAMNSYHIFTTTKALYYWRQKLCAKLDSTSPAPFLAPSWDNRSKKTRFIHMLPRLARLVLAEFDLMDRQLQAAVDELPMEALTGPSPSKAELKKRNRESIETIEVLTTENASLTSALKKEVIFNGSFESTATDFLPIVSGKFRAFSLFFQRLFQMFNGSLTPLPPPSPSRGRRTSRSIRSAYGPGIGSASTPNRRRLMV